MINQGQLPLVYVDANPFIYAVEGDASVASPINALFMRLRERPGSAVTSELTLAEVLPKAPLPSHRRSYLNLMIWSGIFILKPVTREILIDTADYRRIVATKGSSGREILPKLPDAIHVVTAIRSGCKNFLSADTGIRLPHEINLVEAHATRIADLMAEL